MIFQGSSGVGKEDIEKVFALYDRVSSKFINYNKGDTTSICSEAFWNCKTHRWNQESNKPGQKTLDGQIDKVSYRAGGSVTIKKKMRRRKI